MHAILDGAGIDSADLNRVVDFLLYYGVLGIRINGDDYFIYDTNYDLKPLKIRASRTDNDFRYIINQAFWPALNVVKSSK